MSFKPEKPLDSDCCGQGCNPCVFDIYEQELARYEKETQTAPESELKDKDVMKEENFTAFKLIEIIPVTYNTNIYRFEISHSKSLVSQVGQHLILQIITDENTTITRQYTILNVEIGKICL